MFLFLSNVYSHWWTTKGGSVRSGCFTLHCMTRGGGGGGGMGLQNVRVVLRHQFRCVLQCSSELMPNDDGAYLADAPGLAVTAQGDILP